MDSVELSWQKSQFQQIVDMALNAIVMTNARGQIELVNQQLEHIFGYSHQELIGQPIEVLLPERFSAHHIDYRHTFDINPHARNTHDRTDLFGRRKDGSEFPVEIGLNPLHTAAGNKVVATVIDISERLGNLNQLRELTELRQAILDSANFSIICTNSQGIIQVFNKAAERMLGYSQEEMVNRQSPEIIHDVSEVIKRSVDLSEELGTTIEPGFDTFIAKTRLLHVADENEWTYIHKDGTRIPVMLSVTALLNHKEEVTGYLGIGVDLREQKWQESRLDDSEELFRVLYEFSGDAHMVTAPETGFVGANSATAKLFGCKDINQFTTLSPAAVSPEFQYDGQRSADKAQEMMALAMNAGSHQFEWLHQRLDGSLFDADVLLVRMSLGGKTLLKATVRDITERNRSERAKKEFISTVSHELRTPLTSISGALSLIEQGVLGEVAPQALTMIRMAHKNSLRLTDLINDLLDIEKLGAEQMTFNMQNVELMPLINQAMESINSYFFKYHVSCKIIEQCDVQVYVDEGRLIQVLANFLSNAAKFSHHGGQVDVAVNLHHYHQHSAVRVEIIDHGEGVPDEFREKIFQKFSQADSSDTKKKGGTGLGLAISKKLIERMNGAIGYDSVAGSGSCFYFELPLAV